MRTFPLRAALLVLLSCLLLAGCQTTPVPNTLATHNPSRWEKDIAAYEAMDATNPPPAHPIVFVGSSSIRMWRTLGEDFPGRPVINRGFGGSQLADAWFYADRIITKYQPQQVIIYAGGNDLNAGKDPELVYGDFVALTKKIRKDAPKARIGFIASAPNMARWKQIENVRKLNTLVKAYCEQNHMDFIDVHWAMLGPDGMPKNGIYLPDRLHMNAEGYKIWQAIVSPYLL